MRDDLAGLRALLSVAHKKSFTAAAAELRVTPSAVSQTVRALEDRVGVRLLARTTRSVGVTLRTGYADVLRPILGRFLVEYPEIRVDISIDEALTDVVAEGFDAGLRLGH